MNDDVKEVLEGMDFGENYDRFENNIVELLRKGSLDTEKLQRIKRKIEPYMTGELRKVWKETTNKYRKMVEIANEYYPDMGEKITMENERIQAMAKVNRKDIGQYKDLVIDRVSREVADAARYNRDWKEVADRIEGFKLRNKHYINSIAKTQVHSVNRAAKWEKANNAGVKWFAYKGILTETSRPFCRFMVDRVYHIQNIVKMKNGNREPVETYCGGWNCRHDWRPDPMYEGERVPMRTITLGHGEKILVKKKDYEPDYSNTDEEVKKSFKKAGFADPEDDSLQEWISQARWDRNGYRRSDLYDDMEKHASEFDRDFDSGEDFSNFANILMEDADETMYQLYRNADGSKERQLLLFNFDEDAAVAYNGDNKITSCWRNKDIKKAFEGYKKNRRTIWLK